MQIAESCERLDSLDLSNPVAEVLMIQPVYQAHTHFHGATVKSGQDGTRPAHEQLALRLHAAIRCFGRIARSI